MNGVGKSTVDGTKRVMNEKVKNTPKSKEYEGVVSQIPPMYLDSAMTSYVEDVDPFFLSLIINGKNLKNYMIDSGASNTMMFAKIMESLGLKVDTK